MLREKFFSAFAQVDSGCLHNIVIVNLARFHFPPLSTLPAVLELCLSSVQLPFCAPFPWLFRRAGIVFCFRAIPLYALFVVAFVGFPVLRSVLAVVGVLPSVVFICQGFRRSAVCHYVGGFWFPFCRPSWCCHGLPALIVSGLPVCRPFLPCFGFSMPLWGFPCL